MINGQYTQFDSGFSPALIDGMGFDSLRTQLDSGENNAATRAIISEADLITRYMCHSTASIAKLPRLLGHSPTRLQCDSPQTGWSARPGKRGVNGGVSRARESDVDHDVPHATALQIPNASGKLSSEFRKFQSL